MLRSAVGGEWNEYVIEDLNLQMLAFSKKDNRLYLTIDDEAQKNGDRIYLSVTRDDPKGFRYNLITCAPTYKGETIDFTYSASPWLLTIKTEHGIIEICYDSIPELLQIRSDDGLGICFHIEFAPHEMFVDRLDGSLEIGFTSMGQFLFDTVSGLQAHDNRWIGPRMQAAPTTIRWEPKNGSLLGYVYWSNEYVTRQQVNGFDDCVAENRKDYEYWLSQLPPLPERFETVRQIGAYVFWISHQRPLLVLKEPIMYMMRSGIIQRGTTWQQSDHAMACWRNQQFVFDIVHSFFSMQDEYGMLPDCANDRDVAFTATKPPFQGFALTWALDHLGDDAVDGEQCARIYEPLCRWVDWWCRFRDEDRDGLMCYMHGDECGLDDASIFAEGVPVVSPDLQAYLALCMEVCGRLAKILGLQDEAEEHFARSEELIRKMIRRLWNGDQFVCLLEKSGRILCSQSICNYIPIILGKRLPQEIIRKMTADLMDPNKFYTDHGFRSESFDSPLFDSSSPGPFALGMCMAISQLLMTVGLYEAGEKEAALKNAKNWCELSLERGYPVTDIIEKDQVSHRKSNGPAVFNAAVKYTGKFVSWGTPVFFVLGEILNEAEKEN